MLDWLKTKNKAILEPPYSYEFLRDLDSSEYPLYLKEIYKQNMNCALNLKHPKKFSEKIQWLKLYDTIPLKTQLTDKVQVRDWVSEKIGTEYLKPVLQICKNFDELEFERFSSSFIVKANHGCKWHYKVKDKEQFLSNPILIKIMKSHFDGWMQQSFFPYAGFELQYKDIEPKIIAEPLLLDNPDDKPVEIEVYCFNSKPKIIQKICYSFPRGVSIFNEKFEHIDLKFKPDYLMIQEDADTKIKLAAALSEVLSENFKLVRVDWLIYQNKLYFNEMTFTPFSGFYDFEDKKWDYKLGDMLSLI